jgi:ribosome-associated toxin RatA of RatAB toxin-antitoxin module
VHLRWTKVTRMNRRSAILLALGAVTATLTPAGDARAEGSNSRKVERYEVAGKGARAGAARTVVDAPREVVRSVVTDYNRYTDFITRFRSAKIVGKSGDKTDVYLQVPIMNGTVKIWAVVRFDPPKHVGNDLVITSKMLKGNVKRLDANWRIKQLDEHRSELALELTIVPDIPIPDSLVMPEVRYAAAKAVGGSRDEAERRRAKGSEQS